MIAKLSTTTAAALCVLAGTAAAQDACCSKPCPEAGESAVRELTLVPSEAPGVLLTRVAQPEQVRSRTVMVEKNDDHEYKVEIEGDNVKAWIDGERVPSDRVKVSGDRVTIKNADGKTVKEFSRSVTTTVVAPRGHIVLEGHDDPIVWEHEEVDEPEMGMFFGQPEDHPPVMIGINMGSLEESEETQAAVELLGEHDLGPDDAIVVMSVIEDLPADEAGVREGDVIVRLDGDWGASPEKLREVLMEKEPGDELELLVIRDGRRREITLELAEYDTARLGQTMTYTEEVAPFAFNFSPESPEMQELLKKLEAQQGDLDQEIRELVEKLQEKQKQYYGQRLDTMPRFRMWGGEGQTPRALVQPVPGTPALPPRPFAPGAEAFEHQQEQLDRIEERLERLEERLDRVLEALESRERDR